MNSYEKNKWDIRCSIDLGILVESSEDNPLAPVVNSFTVQQINWLSSWLAGDGIGRINQ